MSAEGFVAHLRANPDDVAAWSAYADFLTEKGDPRGEFMRVQLALEDESLTKAERKRHQAAEAKLLAAHREEWAGEVMYFPSFRHEIGYRRGWVYRINADADHMSRVAADPRFLWVRDITVGRLDRQHDVRLLASAVFTPVLRRIQVGNSPEVSYCESCDGITDLIRHSPKLESLILCTTGPAKGVGAVRVPSLRELGIHCQYEYSKTIAQIARNRSFRRLRTLGFCPRVSDFGEARLTLADLTVLAESPNLQGLRELRFSLTDAGDAGVDVLIRSGLLGRLEVLDLTYGNVTDSGAAAIALARPAHLRAVNLTCNAVTPAGVRLLEDAGIAATADHPHAPDDFEYLVTNGDME